MYSMDSKVIQFKPEKSDTEIILLNQPWCQVVLRTPKGEYALGADSRKIVFQRLFDGLSQDLSLPSYEIAGVKVAWVMSLGEKHTSIYVGLVEGNRCLYFQDGNARIITTLRLSYGDVKAWLTSLRECLENIKDYQE